MSQLQTSAVAELELKAQESKEYTNVPEHCLANLEMEI